MAYARAAAVVRNTYRELIDVVHPNILFDWYPEELGRYHKLRDMKFTTIHRCLMELLLMEFLFRVLDKPDDIKKLLSLEVTGGWLNEAREIPPLSRICSLVVLVVIRVRSMVRRCYSTLSDYGHQPPDSDHRYFKLFEGEAANSWL